MQVFTTHTSDSVGYPVFNRQKTLKENCKAIAGCLTKIYSEHEKIFLVCSGSSGLSMATLVAAFMENAEILYLRKEFETQNNNSHSDNRIENDSDYTCGTYPLVIIDDFISSGRTFKRMINQLIAGYAGSSKLNVKIDCVATGSYTAPSEVEDIFNSCGFEEVGKPKFLVSRFIV